MKRALCIWLPQWSLQRLAVDRAELSEHAVVLYKLHAQATARVVAWCPRLASAAAAVVWPGDSRRTSGIRAGMPLAEATALAAAGDAVSSTRDERSAALRDEALLDKPAVAPGASMRLGHCAPSPRPSPARGEGERDERSAALRDEALLDKPAVAPGMFTNAALHLEPADPEGDRLALEALAGWCQRFSPTVGVEEAAEPESLLLDVTGLGRLVGGEESLARAIIEDFQRRGLTARVAIADTPSAAWAVAHFAALDPRAWGQNLGSHAGGGQSRRSRLESEVVGRFRGGQSHFAQHEVVRHAGGGQSHFAARTSQNWDSPLAILSALRVPCIVSEGATWAALAPLPVAALRLAAETCRQLAELGLRRIEQIAALPRATLLARFGPEVLLRLDRATGAAPEAIVACAPPAEWEFEWPFEHPTARGEMIEFALGELVARACAALARERLGVLRLECRFDYEEESSERFVVGLYRANSDARHVGDLARLKLERLRLRGPVTALRVTVLAHGALEFHQQEMLFAAGQSEREAPGELAALVDRLSNRLGPRAVARPWLLAEAQPEFACQYQPLSRLSGGRRAKKPRGVRARKKASGAKGEKHWQDASATQVVLVDRPLHLEPRPRALVVVSVAPEGPPMKFRLAGQDERVARVWGPERIETGWWRTRIVRRDYYQVETERGARYWLFRELAGGAWFLHGEFA